MSDEEMRMTDPILRKHIEQAIRDGGVCRRQQFQGLVPIHDGSSCYVCEQWEKSLLEKDDKEEGDD